MSRVAVAKSDSAYRLQNDDMDTQLTRFRSRLSTLVTQIKTTQNEIMNGSTDGFQKKAEELGKLALARR